MVDAGYEILVGAVLGFSLAGPPGPMNAYIAAQAVHSRRQGIVSGFGAMSADAVLGTVIFLLSSAVDLRAVEPEVYVVGGLALSYFGYRLLRAPVADPPPPVSDTRTYSTALALGLANPFQILWWLTAGLAFAYLGGLPLFIGLFGAIAIWIVGFPTVVHAGTRRSSRVGRAVTYVSGAVMLAFAAYFFFLAGT